MKVKNFKEYKKKEKEVERRLQEWVREYHEKKLFDKFVPVYLQRLMIRFPWLKERLDYEINNVDGDYNRLVISRRTLFRRRFKLLGKTF